MGSTAFLGTNRLSSPIATFPCPRCGVRAGELCVYTRGKRKGETSTVFHEPRIAGWYKGVHGRLHHEVTE